MLYGIKTWKNLRLYFKDTWKNILKTFTILPLNYLGKICLKNHGCRFEDPWENISKVIYSYYSESPGKESLKINDYCSDDPYEDILEKNPRLLLCGTRRKILKNSMIFAWKIFLKNPRKYSRLLLRRSFGNNIRTLLALKFIGNIFSTKTLWLLLRCFLK